jgi:ribosomal protein S12 methylthiotransferase
MTTGRFWLETLGCPKNEVDSDKLVAQLVAEGYEPSESVEGADLIVVNTCAFIEAAREESLETILELSESKEEGARLVVTGCMAERYGQELADSLPEVDLVAGFGSSLTQVGPTRVALSPTRDARANATLLDLPRATQAGPWAYVKVAEGCDRRCGFCAIPSFRGLQRSRSAPSIIDEVDRLVEGGTKEIVLIAQDLASWGLDRNGGGDALEILEHDDQSSQPLVALTKAVAERAERVRLLYLYPSGLTESLIDAVLETNVPYFDLSLQHASGPLLRRMRRWGNGDKFLDRIAAIRKRNPDSSFRSSFIVGYPGETEADHDELLAFVEAAQLDWAGFFSFSNEAGTYAAELDGHVAPELVAERLSEVSSLQDEITMAKREALIGSVQRVLVDAPGVARSVHEAPEIDGIIEVDDDLMPGTLLEIEITGSLGTDLVGRQRETR